MRSPARSRSRMRRRSSPGTRTSRSARRTTTQRRFGPRKRPDTTTGSRAGSSGTRRATTRLRLSSRSLRELAAAVLASGESLFHLSKILVEDSLLIGGENRADLDGLLVLKIHHLGASRLVRRTADSLGLLAQFHLLRHVLLTNRLDLRLLGLRQSDVFEQHSAHSAATARFALTLLRRLGALCCGDRSDANAECSSQRGDANSLHPSLLIVADV